MRCIAILLVALMSFALSTSHAEPEASDPTLAAQSPANYILLTVVLRHYHSRTFEEIVEHLDTKQFWTQFPPQGIEVESWYAMMGLGHVITLRVPPARLREVNLSIEKTAWGVFRTEFYATYDYLEIARQWRESALKQQ